MAPGRRASITKGCNRPFTVSVRTSQQLWLLEANEACNSSLTLCMRNLPRPHTARLRAVSIPSRTRGESPARRVRCPRSFEPDRYQSRTSGVGNCWSYSRSRLQSPTFRLLNVTRQRRALPSTTLRFKSSGRRHASHLLRLLKSKLSNCCRELLRIGFECLRCRCCLFDQRCVLLRASVQLFYG